MKNTLILLLLLPFLSNQTLFSQCIDGFLPSGAKCGGTVQTAVPFLRITPDARSGAMGDVGIALSPDANSIFYNASKLAMADKKWGVAANYSPWLRNLGINDIYLLHEAGYFQFGKDKKQAIGIDFRYFNLGNITWTDFNAQPIGEGNPYEMAFTGSYSRLLNENWALGVSGKYIYSNLASGVIAPSGAEIRPAKSGAVDISATYKKTFSVTGLKSDLRVGAAVSNLGSKITYLRTSDFLPANLGIGAAWDINLNAQNRLTLAIELNKLLVPTPQPSDTSGGWRNVGVLKGVFKSFNDAPGGTKEELREITASVGLEYWCMKHVALRAGYFKEDKLKGGREYFTVGAGVRYRAVGFNFSYLLPTNSQRGPLDNTMRFSLLFNGNSFDKEPHHVSK
jgi:Type IX secretion system protein PorV